MSHCGNNKCILEGGLPPPHASLGQCQTVVSEKNYFSPLFQKKATQELQEFPHTQMVNCGTCQGKLEIQYCLALERGGGWA